jgi:hypothetical protein
MEDPLPADLAKGLRELQVTVATLEEENSVLRAALLEVDARLKTINRDADVLLSKMGLLKP